MTGSSTPARVAVIGYASLGHMAFLDRAARPGQTATMIGRRSLRPLHHRQGAAERAEPARRRHVTRGAASDRVGRAWLFAEKLEAGQIGVNVNDTTELQAPFGGWKMSGIGRELGPEGLMTFRERKHIKLRLGG